MDFTASAGTANGFNLSYSGVTAPSAGVYTFTTGSHSGAGGSSTAIASSPDIVVSTCLFQRGTATTANVNNNGSTHTLTIAKPTGVVSGDVMIANITNRRRHCHKLRFFVRLDGNHTPEL